MAAPVSGDREREGSPGAVPQLRTHGQHGGEARGRLAGSARGLRGACAPRREHTDKAARLFLPGSYGHRIIKVGRDL